MLNYFKEYHKETTFDGNETMLLKNRHEYNIPIYIKRCIKEYRQPQKEMENLFILLWSLVENNIFVKSTKKIGMKLSDFNTYKFLERNNFFISEMFDNVNIPIFSGNSNKVIFLSSKNTIDEEEIKMRESLISKETSTLNLDSTCIPLSKVSQYNFRLDFNRTLYAYFPNRSYEINHLKESGYKIYGEDCEIYLIGFWNFAKNKIWFIEKELEKNYKLQKLISKKIKENRIYLEISKNSANPFSIGMEMEFLLKNQETTVVSATEAYINILDNLFKMPDSQKESLKGNRELTNRLFTNSNLGCDGRRILGEARFFPQEINIKNSYNKAIESFIIQLKQYFYLLYKNNPNFSLRLGGGEQGESIGSHIHFALPYKEEFVKILNNFVGLPLQKMIGGARPELVNPADRFTTNVSERRHNDYGNIMRGIVIDSGSRRDIIRTKTYENDKMGWEYRPMPSFQINKTFTKNVLLSILEILKLDYKKQEVEIKEWNINEVIKTFGYVPYIIEYFYMTKILNLEINPLLYWISSLRNEIKSRLVITEGVSLGIDKKIIRDILVDYIPTRNNKRMFFKVSKCKTSNLIINKNHLSDIKVLFNTYGINLPIKCEEIPLNSFRIYLKEKDKDNLFNIMKSCCLSY